MLERLKVMTGGECFDTMEEFGPKLSVWVGVAMMYGTLILDTQAATSCSKWAK